jgi:hypothetical protein
VAHSDDAVLLAQLRPVEVTFEAEEVSSVSDESGILTLYRTPEDTYFVYIIDARKNGEQAVLEIGHYPHGHTESSARHMWPELFRPQRRQ